MAEDNLVLAVAVLAVIASLAAAGFSYYSLAGQGPKVIGFATSEGKANLTVLTVANINFTTAVVMWGAGAVDTGKTFATLDTENNVVDGNWTQVNTPLTLENIGNVNVSLQLKAGKSAADFIGGTSPAYTWKVSDAASNTGACTGNQITTYTATATSDTATCTSFLVVDTSDAIDIDINITVPYDSKKGLLSDTITATGTAQ